jgi:16S rRNA (adenine1518-N6/adenine1519-N6)-dimethyltransferase
LNHHSKKIRLTKLLYDPSIIQLIAQAIAPHPYDNLLEISPGQGTITTELLPVVGRIQAIELDRDLTGLLAQRCAALGNLQTHNTDALKFDAS